VRKADQVHIDITQEEQEGEDNDKVSIKALCSDTLSNRKNTGTKLVSGDEF